MYDYEEARAAMGIMTIITLILVAIVGGNFRTELDFGSSEPAINSQCVSFQETLTTRHWLAGLIQGKQPDIQRVLDKYIRHGERMVFTKIITKHTWVDNLLAGLTFFVYCPMTVQISGAVQATTLADR